MVEIQRRHLGRRLMLLQELFDSPRWWTPRCVLFHGHDRVVLGPEVVLFDRLNLRSRFDRIVLYYGIVEAAEKPSSWGIVNEAGELFWQTRLKYARKFIAVVCLERPIL